MHIEKHSNMKNKIVSVTNQTKSALVKIKYQMIK